MAARGNLPGVPMSPNNGINYSRRPTLEPVGGRDSASNLPRNLTSATTVRFDDEKPPQSPLEHSDSGPKHLIRKLDHGDHRRTDSLTNGNGHANQLQGIHGVDQLTRHGTASPGSPSGLRREETFSGREKEEGEGWMKRMMTWGSGSTKKRGDGKGGPGV
ncbi:MAG: hypothetical protein Q9183_006158 [Haloplaca sp. 2 TL-2023]